jgi:hypothetical protein
MQEHLKHWAMVDAMSRGFKIEIRWGQPRTYPSKQFTAISLCKKIRIGGTTANEHCKQFTAITDAKK